MDLIHRYKASRAAESFNNRWAYMMPGTVQVGYTITSVASPLWSVVTLHGVLTRGVQYEAWLTTPQGVLVHESTQDIESFTIAVGGLTPKYVYIVCRVIWAEDEALQGSYLVVDIADYEPETDTIIALVYRNIATVEVYQHTPNSRNWPFRLLKDPIGVKQIVSFDFNYATLASAGTTSFWAAIQEPYGGRRYSLQSSLVQWLRLNIWFQLAGLGVGGIRLNYNLYKMRHNTAAVTVTDTLTIPCGGIMVAPLIVKAVDDADASDLYDAAEYDQDAVWMLNVNRVGDHVADTYPLNAYLLCGGVEYVMRQPGELF